MHAAPWGTPPALAQRGTQLLGAIIISGAEGGGEGSGPQAETSGRGCWGVKQKNHTGGPWDLRWRRPSNLAPTLPEEAWLPPLAAAPAMKMTPLGEWSLLRLLGEQSDIACRAGTGQRAADLGVASDGGVLLGLPRGGKAQESRLRNKRGQQ